MPRSMEKLAMLQSENNEFNPLFVVSSQGGAFYVFDAEGTLHHQGDFQTEDSDSAVRWLEGMGVDANTGYLISVLRNRDSVYQVRLE